MKRLLLSAMLLLGVTAVKAQNVYTYYFNGNFHEASGVGPDLTPICTGSFVQDTLTDFGGMYREVYKFDQNCGFQFDDSLGGFISGKTYTIELYFKMDNLSSWKRVIDYKMRSTDYGCYVFNGQLNFYSFAYGSGAPFSANEYSHYVITRNDTTKDVMIYGDGDDYITYNDVSEHAVYNANMKLRFFQDDLSVPNEASSGSIGILRIYNYALDSNTVEDNYTDLSGTLGIKKTHASNVAASAYPNPVSDVLSIKLPTDDTYQYRIVSFTGSVIKTGSLNNGSNTIDVQQLPAGMYMIRLSGKDGLSGALKFSKQ